MNVDTPGEAALLARPAEAQDVTMLFLLVLGRRPGRARDIEYHLGAPLSRALVHLLSSAEFADRVLPNLGADIDRLRRPAPAGLPEWTGAIFGPATTGEQRHWPDLLLRCLATPVLTRLAAGRAELRRRLAAVLPAPEPVRLPDLAPVAGNQRPDALPSIVPHQAEPSEVGLLLLGNAAAASAAAPGEEVEAARRLLLSPAFLDGVLGRLAAGALPFPAAAAPVPPAVRETAFRFFGGRLVPQSGEAAEPWTRLLMRLLHNADSALRPDPEAWAAAGLPAGETARLAVAAAAARNRLAEVDPLVAHRIFTAAATPSAAGALFRYLLGRAPSQRDDLVEAAQRGHPANLLRLLLAPEFERVALRPLQSGRPLRHAEESGFDDTHLADLAAVLGRPPEAPVDWARDLAVILGAPDLVAALRATPVRADQEAGRTYVLDALARLHADTQNPPPIRAWFDVREDRRLVVFCRGLPPGRKLVVDVALDGPKPLTRRIEATRVTDTRWDAGLTLPVLSFEPHAWIGTAAALCCDQADRCEPLGAPLPVRVALGGPTLDKLRARLDSDVRRAGWLADAGRRREATALLAQIVADMPLFTGAPAMVASFAAAAGELAAAEAALAEAPATDALAAELRARLALRAGRVEEAAAGFAALDMPGGLRGAALRLLAAASAPLPAEPPPAGDPSWLRDAALRLLHAPAQPALPFAVALGAADLPGRDGLAREVVAALALAFAPPDSLGEFLRELDAVGLLPIGRALADPELRRLGHLLLPALATLPVDRIGDADLLLAVARTLDAAGRTEPALRFAEAATWIAPDGFDARSLAATFCQRLRLPDQAIAHLEQASRLRPDDLRIAERLLAAEIEARRLDPLRSSERQDQLMSKVLDSAQRQLLKAPRAPAARLEYARIAALAERFDEATTILRALAGEDLSARGAIQMLLRISQYRNDHEAALEWFGHLREEEVDERSVIWAAKSHRGLGQVAEAQALLDAHLEGAGPALRREYVRNLFFDARFEFAAEEAARMLRDDPNDFDLRFLAAAANLELRRDELAYFHVAWIQLHGGASLFPLEMPLFLYAVTHRNGDSAGALAQLDPMFARVGAQSVRFDPRLPGPAFDRLCPTGSYPEAGGPNAPIFDGPKVSVVMTAWNVRDYVRTAARSILQQSYRNLELIIVDDASTDGTPQILAEIERSDPRVKVILKSTNDGTYVSKNLGLLQAQGEFVALQDSDDWSHPDRLACSIGALQRNPELVGLTTDWLRMTSDGDIVVKAGGQIAHLCCISLVFRRSQVLGRVGFFDSVRIAADLEFIQRIGLAFGAHRVPRLRWPLLFGRTRSDSLTASEEFGITRAGFTEPRALYHRHAEAFHRRIAGGGSPFMPFPLRTRAFEAPSVILPEGPKP